MNITVEKITKNSAPEQTIQPENTIHLEQPDQPQQPEQFEQPDQFEKPEQFEKQDDVIKLPRVEETDNIVNDEPDDEVDEELLEAIQKYREQQQPQQPVNTPDPNSANTFFGLNGGNSSPAGLKMFIYSSAAMVLLALL